MHKSNYEILIVLKTTDTSTKELYKGRIVYRDSQGKADHVVINNHSIKLTCSRRKRRDIDQLLADSNSTIVEQITKTICFLAAITGEIPTLESIQIQRDINGHLTKRNYSESELILPKGSWKDTKLFFPINAFDALFNSHEKTSILMIAVSNWVKAMAEEEEGARFTGLWRCYNTLYSFITTKRSDDFNLRYMSNFIKDNSQLFPESIKIIKNLNKHALRNFSWRKLILNDYNTESKTFPYAEFILRNHDWRMNDIFFDTLGYRHNFLKVYKRKTTPNGSKQIRITSSNNDPTLFDEVMSHLSHYSPAKQEYDLIMSYINSDPNAKKEYTEVLNNVLRKKDGNKYIKKAYDEILTHIEQYSSTKIVYEAAKKQILQNPLIKTVRDDEVLAFMINKYIYYLRNKIFHGERIDPTFKLIADKDIGDIQGLNKLLSTYLLELISANHAY